MVPRKRYIPLNSGAHHDDQAGGDPCGQPDAGDHQSDQAVGRCHLTLQVCIEFTKRPNKWQCEADYQAILIINQGTYIV